MHTRHRTRLAVGALILAVWTVNGLLWTSQTLIASGLESRPARAGAALLMSLGMAYVWALLTPLILWLGRRFPIDRERWASRLAAHLALSVALAFPLAAIKVLLARLAGRYPAIAAPLLDRTLVNFVSWVDMDVLLYWIVLAVGQAVSYLAALRDRERKAAELEIELGRAQLRALESQLHPHFLFNALNTVSALVRTGQNGLAIRVVAGLGDLLRRALDAGRQSEVALRQELEFIDRYLEIEGVRFGDRLTVRRDISPDTLDAAVPSFLLQPLVENAMRHGLGRRAGASCLEIGSRRRNGRLELRVRDDGPGLPGDWEPSRNVGVGLRSVRERLLALYGEGQSFLIHDAEGGGVEARLSLPFAVLADEWRTGS